MTERGALLAELIRRTHPDAGAEKSRDDACGVMIAEYTDWTGERISNIFLAALEDANYHSFAKYTTLNSRQVISQKEKTA
jgi:hypothetical protein